MKRMRSGFLDLLFDLFEFAVEKFGRDGTGIADNDGRGDIPADHAADAFAVHFQEHAGGLAAHLFHGGLDDGERGIGVSGELQAGGTDEKGIGADVDVAFAKGAEGAERKKIAGGEDGVGDALGIEIGFDVFVADGFGHIATGDEIDIAGGHAGFEPALHEAEVFVVGGVADGEAVAEEDSAADFEFGEAACNKTGGKDDFGGNEILSGMLARAINGDPGYVAAVEFIAQSSGFRTGEKKDAAEGIEGLVDLGENFGDGVGVAGGVGEHGDVDIGFAELGVAAADNAIAPGMGFVGFGGSETFGGIRPDDGNGGGDADFGAGFDESAEPGAALDEIGGFEFAEGVLDGVDGNLVLSGELAGGGDALAGGPLAGLDLVVEVFGDFSRDAFDHG